MMSHKVNKAIKIIYENKGVGILAALVVSLFILENQYPLRRRKASKIKRTITNIEMAATASIGFRYFLIPSLVWSSIKSEEGKHGLLYHLRIPAEIKGILGFLFLDYGNYIWHRLSHKFPVLWRFHQVHHSDLDLDMSTAFRFHLGEILPSAVFRAAIIWMLGVNWKWVLYYEIAFEGANNFHHSNFRLQKDLAENLKKFLVTPEMHGIHHSIVKEETDSNYSVIFNFWDRLHETLKLNIPQESINIGMPAFRDDDELQFFNLMVIPFKKQKDWKLPDGIVPKR